MTLATEVKKITRSKPFYALTGAGDLALEKARSYALTVQGKAETVARDMPEKARKYADSAAQRLTRLYDELAARGQRVVGRVSGETARELTETARELTKVAQSAAREFSAAAKEAERGAAEQSKKSTRAKAGSRR